MKKNLFTLLFAFSLLTNLWSQEAFIGEIRMFAGSFAPMDWLLCQGQTLPILQYQALYSIIGNTYGGDGRTTFVLPNLCGRVPIGSGSGSGLTYRMLGQAAGAETVTLNSNQMPLHYHSMVTTTATATTNTPSASVVPATAQLPASGATGAKNVNIYAPSAGNTVLYSNTSTVGANQSHENMMPYLVLNYIICVNGIYPARP